MDAPQIVAELSRLYELEVEAAQAYAAAVQAVGHGPVHEELTIFWLEHQRHAIELHQAILALGCNAPAVSPDVKGVVIGALTPLRRRLTLQDVLEGVRGNEQLTNALYAKALAKALPPDVRELVSRLHADEQRHLAWLERMVARRVWEAGREAAHP